MKQKYAYEVGNVINGKRILKVYKKEVDYFPYSVKVCDIECIHCGKLSTAIIHNLFNYKEEKCKGCKEKKHINERIGPFRLIEPINTVHSRKKLWKCVCENCGKVYTYTIDSLKQYVKRKKDNEFYCMRCFLDHTISETDKTHSECISGHTRAACKSKVPNKLSNSKGMPRNTFWITTKRCPEQYFGGRVWCNGKPYAIQSKDIFECLAYVCETKLLLNFWTLNDVEEYLMDARNILLNHVKLSFDKKIVDKEINKYINFFKNEFC